MNLSSIVPLGLVLLGTSAAGQEGYRLPPAEVVDIVDAPPPPSVELSPDGRWMILLERGAMPTIEDVSRPMLRLAGMRIDPAADARYRTSFYEGARVRRMEGGEAVAVPLPAGGRLAAASWSHDSRNVLLTVIDDRGTELWTTTPGRPDVGRRITRRMNGVLGRARVLPDGEAVLLLETPEGRGAAPAAPLAPSGPNVRETAGRTTPLRTYQDLLANPHDEALFEHHATTRVTVAKLDGSSRKHLGEPAVYTDAVASPDGKHLLVTRVEPPWSYVMPYWLFAQRIEVWDRDGRVEHLVAALPAAEGVPIGGVRTGPRMVGWKTGEPATLAWAEALDGGDPDREVEHRDRWLTLSAPFDDDPLELLRVEHRATGLAYLDDPVLVISREYDRDRRWTRTLLHNVGGRRVEPRVLDDRSTRDRYADPGRMLSIFDRNGSRVVQRLDGWVYRAGSGASPEGLLPFLDRQNLKTLETERIWRCAEGSYESVATLLVPEAEADGPPPFVTRHETPDSPPNYRLRRGDEVTALTEFPDPTPQIRGIEKRLVEYERADGVPLSATLYLPADHAEGERLPLLVWAYPLEFNDPRTAGQVSSSPWRFTRISGTSHLALLTQGYCIMDGATMPVIGDPETMNDTFVEQIVAAAEAAIRKAAELGVADPDRAAVGGHSYGAFMTANLLAHSDLFRAGIARSGAYNRTLTPFGFQSERRTIWEAPEAYFRVSPFFHADRIAEPLLMIHGEIDSNSGTFPMQSERLFQAIKGTGGTARLVMLPNESHGYRGRESVLHVLAEMIDWLDLHVKGAETREAPGTTEAIEAASSER